MDRPRYNSGNTKNNNRFQRVPSRVSNIITNSPSKRNWLNNKFSDLEKDRNISKSFPWDHTAIHIFAWIFYSILIKFFFLELNFSKILLIEVSGGLLLIGFSLATWHFNRIEASIDSSTRLSMPTEQKEKGSSIFLLTRSIKSPSLFL